MPTYEYECPLCGHFEVEQRITENSLNAKPGCSEKKCPHAAERVISATSFQLKGGGWYKTDYASSSSGSSSSKSTHKKEDKGTSSESTSPTSDSSEKKETKSDGDSSASLKTAGKCGTKCGCH